MEVNEHVVVPVAETTQPIAARMAARDLAERIGFSEEDIYRVRLIATELATNLVKHTSAGGEILFRASSADREVELVSIDRGPGMSDLSAAMRDGHSTAGSPGNGLGAVRRLADTFDIHSVAGKGTVVVARIRAARTKAPRHVLDVAGISVAYPGEPICGDAWAQRGHFRGDIAAVADGLGHGPMAAEAAHRAMGRLAEARFDELTGALEVLHDALRPTRGAALALLQVDPAAGVVRFAGVGNIAAAILRNGSVRQAVSSNGTLGHEARRLREYAYPWDRTALFVMHSDGLISHWSLAAYPGLELRHPAVIAAVLYRDFTRGRDDVTVVVGREAA